MKNTRFCVWMREETLFMLTIRTDLAMEAHQLWREKAGETTKLSGVSAREEELEGFPLTRVEILDQEDPVCPRGRKICKKGGNKLKVFLAIYVKPC